MGESRCDFSQNLIDCYPIADLLNQLRCHHINLLCALKSRHGALELSTLGIDHFIDPPITAIDIYGNPGDQDEQSTSNQCEGDDELQLRLVPVLYGILNDSSAAFLKSLT